MRVVVKRERPLLKTLLVVLAGVALASAGVYFVDSELRGFDYQIDQLRKERQQLARENQQLTQENESLLRRVAVVERSTQIESRAYAQVNQDLRALQEELQLVKEEVSFYQGILSDGRRSGVRLQRFVLEPGDSNLQRRFRMVLTQSSEDNVILSGAVEFSVEGERNGSSLTLNHREVESPARDGIPFKFRHFQRLEGQLTLPDDFLPRSVVVRVRSDNTQSSPVRESFVWPIKDD